MRACLSVYHSLYVCMPARLCVCLSVTLNEIGQSICQSLNQSAGLLIGQSGYVLVCVLLSASICLSLAAEGALATKHPMA